RPGHLERADVVAPAGELMLLARGNLTARIEHADADAAPLVERGRDGTARVAGRGNEYRERPSVFGGERQRALDDGREEPGTDVLERGRRAVKELEDGELARHERLQRHREIERVGANRRNVVLEDGTREKRREKLGRDLGQRLAAEPTRRKPRQRLRHEQAAVGGKTAQDRVDEAGFLRAACARVAHIASTV